MMNNQNNHMPTALNETPSPHRRLLLRRTLLVASFATIAVLAAACTSAQSSPTTTRIAPTGSSAPTKSLELASATLPGVGSVLTGPNGRTLYYFTTDSPNATACTGECAVVWPPLLVPAGRQPVLTAGVPGTLGTVMRPDGSTQVTYDRHLLYYYQGDMAAGQDKGQGVGGTWFVLMASATAPAATAPPATAPPTTATPGIAPAATAPTTPPASAPPTTAPPTTTTSPGGGGGVGF